MPNSASLMDRLQFISAYAFQLEMAPNTGRLHWQGWARNMNAKTFKQWQLLLPGAHIEQQKARFTKAATDYCCKENTRAKAADVAALGWPVEEIGPHVKGIVLERPKVMSVLNDQNMYPWQRAVVGWYDSPIHPRTIHWMFEAEGNTGKSALVKHLCLQGKTLVVDGAAADVACGVARWINPEKGEPKELRLVVWDVPRCNMGHVSYASIEKIKNGCFFSGKYESGMVMMNTPHVLIVANQPPDFAKLSRDRWVIYTITRNKELEQLEPVWSLFDAKTRGTGEVPFKVVTSTERPPMGMTFEPRATEGGTGGGGGAALLLKPSCIDCGVSGDQFAGLARCDECMRNVRWD
jgi:hypothetical protein